jgi:hypothetical protein
VVGISKFTLFAWKQRFEEKRQAGLLDKPKMTPAGNRLPELSKRTILMLEHANPDWGCPRISDMLVRGGRLASLLRA